MADATIEVIDAEDGIMPSLTDEQVDALILDIRTQLRDKAGTRDVTKVTGLILADVLLQMFEDPEKALFEGIRLLGFLISALVESDAQSCDCADHDHHEEIGRD
jgi:hypothetical protein